MDRRGVAGTFFGVTLAGGIAAMIGAPPLASPYFDTLLYGGAVAVAAGVIGLLWLFLFPTKRLPEARATVDQRVTSTGQTGGVTAHTINLSPPDRALDDHARAKLLREARKGLPVEVEAPSNDAEAERLAGEIVQFLRASGYDVTFAADFRPGTAGALVSSRSVTRQKCSRSGSGRVIMAPPA